MLGWRAPVVLGAVLLLGPALVSSCASPAAVAPPAEQTPAQLTPPPVADLPELPRVSALTGLPVDLTAPVLCVKIDNERPARPQSGLEVADLVYVEPIEGGASRLLAVFQSELPPVVGPVRSVRESDLQLLANFGRPALAFSGEAPPLRPLIDQAPVVDVSIETRPQAYYRDRGRYRPHNLYADPALLLADNTEPVRDIGFRFGPAPSGGEPLTETTVRYNSAAIGFQWLAGEERWVVSMDGAALLTASGARPAATTVVLQRVPVSQTSIRDAAGSPSPFAATVGSGEVLVLREGRAFAGQWSRPAPEQPTAFTLPNGEPLTFAPGPVWVVLVPM